MGQPDSESDGTFNSLRGFLSGQESSERVYFAHSAALRIFGRIPSLDQLTHDLGVRPTSSHRIGERQGPKSPPFKHDLWSFQAEIGEERPLSEHIDALWRVMKPKCAILKQLKRTLDVDVFLGYRSNCDHAGIEVPHSSLEMFIELELPFGVSIIIA